MGERTEYAPGTPSWVDLGSPDVQASIRFYGEVMGWQAEPAGPPDQARGYTLFLLGGKRVAGVGEGFPGAPPMWTTYVSVDDAAATTERVKELGGKVIAEPMAILDAGTMAVFMDPIGAVFAVWQPGQHKGAEIVNDPGSLCWNELDAPNADEAIPFYTALFGWEAESSDMAGMPYTLFNMGGTNMGGATKADGPARWGVSFAVEDPDATTAKAKELGGSALLEPQDLPIGRFAVLADPQGAVFGVIRLERTDP